MAALFLNNSRIGHNSKIEQNKKKCKHFTESQRETQNWIDFEKYDGYIG